MLEVGTKLCIKGDWDQTPAPAGRLPILLVPQQTDFAFGNAYKPSTLAYLGELETLITPGCTVLDIGTGVGVLAIGAVVLGASKVTAVEPLDIGIHYCTRNLAVNNVADKVELIQGWFPVPLPYADLVLCNIDTLGVLEDVANARLANRVVVMPAESEIPALEAIALRAGYVTTKKFPVRAYQYTLLEKSR